MSTDHPLSHGQAKTHIRQLWETGYVTWTTHAQNRMKQRHLSMSDIEYIVRYGYVTEHSHPGRYWRYKFVGKTVEGESLACVIEIQENVANIITVMHAT